MLLRSRSTLMLFSQRTNGLVSDFIVMLAGMTLTRRSTFAHSGMVFVLLPAKPVVVGGKILEIKSIH